jgi:hypothetical protein
VKGLLDDAYELAERLHETLRDAELGAVDNNEPYVRVSHIRDLKDAADDLGNQIDRQRTALRGS